MKAKLTRLIISLGLGGKTLKQIEKIKAHLESVINPLLSKARKFVITKCKKSNAIFKIRKGIPLGLKITLRKEEIKPFLNLKLDLKYDCNSLYQSFSDHKLLRLERYNPFAPEYGLNLRFIFEREGCRVKYRRISPRKLKDVISKEECHDLLYKQKN